MGLVFGLVSVLDRVGLRSLVAKLATAASPSNRFSVEGGRWINDMGRATLSGTTINTMTYDALREIVTDNWCWSYLPKEGDTIIDVGAGRGEEAIIFSHIVGEKGRVISIEAHPETFACLQETIQRSGLRNVTALQCAVADKKGELLIADGDNHLASSVVGTNKGTIVPADTIDGICAALGINRVTLLKMNIEGAERLAVTGIDRVRVDHTAISCHDFIADRTGDDSFRAKDAVRSFLEAKGFSLSARPDASTPWMRDYLYGTFQPSGTA